MGSFSAEFDSGRVCREQMRNSKEFRVARIHLAGLGNGGLCFQSNPSISTYFGNNDSSAD